jgi:hypothetical protein
MDLYDLFQPFIFKTTLGGAGEMSPQSAHPSNSKINYVIQLYAICIDLYDLLFYIFFIIYMTVMNLAAISPHWSTIRAAWKQQRCVR